MTSCARTIGIGAASGSPTGTMAMSGTSKSADRSSKGRCGAEPSHCSRSASLPDGRPLTRLAIAEAPINALSLAAIEGLRPDTIYAATGSGMGAGTISAIEQILAWLAH